MEYLYFFANATVSMWIVEYLTEHSELSLDDIAHGKPNREDIEAFKQQFIQGSGSCPKSLR